MRWQLKFLLSLRRENSVARDRKDRRGLSRDWYLKVYQSVRVLRAVRDEGHSRHQEP